jgi:uncharacterized cupredoxin-like copper-binding protein
LYAPNVLTAHPGEDLSVAASRMQFHEIGALAVYDNGNLAGIITERDVLRAVGEGRVPEVTTVAEYMSPDPVAVTPEIETGQAAALMLSLGARHLSRHGGRRAGGDAVGPRPPVGRGLRQLGRGRAEVESRLDGRGREATMETWRRLVTPRRGLLAAVLLAGLALPACAGGGGTVEVTLQEFSIIPAQESVSAGEVTFEVENTGPEDVHEFVVIETDLAQDALPTDENGVVEEEGEGMEVIDEIEDIPVGETQNVTVDLDAGNYVLICNIWTEEEQEAHYAMGMRTAFTVE